MVPLLGSLALGMINAKQKGNNDKKVMIADAIQQVRENPANVTNIAQQLQTIGIKKV